MNEIFTCDQKNHREYENHAISQINNAMEIIKQKIANYADENHPIPVTRTTDNNRANQIARERENERERVR